MGSSPKVCVNIELFEIVFEVIRALEIRNMNSLCCSKYNRFCMRNFIVGVMGIGHKEFISSSGGYSNIQDTLVNSSSDWAKVRTPEQLLLFECHIYTLLLLSVHEVRAAGGVHTPSRLARRYASIEQNAMILNSL